MSRIMSSKTQEPIKDVIRHYSFENKLVQTCIIHLKCNPEKNQSKWILDQEEISKIFTYFYKMQ